METWRLNATIWMASIGERQLLKMAAIKACASCRKPLASVGKHVLKRCSRVRPGWDTADRWFAELHFAPVVSYGPTPKRTTDMKSSYRNLIILCLLASASLAQAVTTGFFAPAWRGSANSEFGLWETYGTPVGAPGNLANSGTTGAVLTQSDPMAMSTGSGNIYGFFGIANFSLADAVPFEVENVLLQTRTAGVELVLNQTFLNYTDGSGAHSLAPVASGLLDQSAQPGGTGYSRYWQWDLTGLAITDYTVGFLASGQHLSFDAMTLDVANQFTVVPEPSAVTVGALGGLLMMMAARLSMRRTQT